MVEILCGKMITRNFFSDGDKMAEKPSDKYTRVLHDMPVLGTDDTVFILLHGNAKVHGLWIS